MCPFLALPQEVSTLPRSELADQREFVYVHAYWAVPGSMTQYLLLFCAYRTPFSLPTHFWYKLTFKSSQLSKVVPSYKTRECIVVKCYTKELY